MSHFAVLVVTPEPPTQEVLERTLAPWHEFECTGYVDEYVIDVDKTEEAREAFNVAMESTRGEPNGHRFDDAIPASAATTFAAWASWYYGWPIVTSEASIDLEDTHKSGYIRVGADGEVIRCVARTNPDAKWDAWQLGGRYSGRLAPGYDPETDPDNMETCALCAGTGKRCDPFGNAQRATDPAYTCDRCQGRGISLKWPTEWTGEGSTAKWGDLDFAVLKASAVQERRALVEDMREKARLSADDFDVAMHAFKAAHRVWYDMGEPRPRDAEYDSWLKKQARGDLAARYAALDMRHAIDPAAGQTVEQWISSAPALSAYAVVIDGQWFARDDIGRGGVSPDEADDWPMRLQAILDSIPDDHYVSLVDCHI